MSTPRPDLADGRDRTRRSLSGVGLVTSKGAVLAEACEGFADLDAGRRWTPGTRSQIASISKQFAAAVALILVDRGCLRLAEPVAEVLADVPAQWRDVTVQHLLTHTSGMNHWRESLGFDPSQPLDAGERLLHLLAAPLFAAPGDQWRYSSPGYIVLSAVLAAAAQRPYAQLVQEGIIEPLGLSDTTVGRSAVSTDALGYRDGEPVTPWDLHTMPGTGDIWSTAADLACFITALHGGTLLPERVRATLHDVSVDHDPTESPGPISVNGYGLGHFFGTVFGRFAYLHPGDNPGYLSLGVWLPATQTAAVVLTNDEADDIDQRLTDLFGRGDNFPRP